MSAKLDPKGTYILTYESKTHGKRRYFVADPGKNPAQDGKPQWSYEGKDAAVLSCQDAMAFRFVLAIYGYGSVEAVAAKPKPKLVLIQGGKVGE